MATIAFSQMLIRVPLPFSLFVTNFPQNFSAFYFSTADDTK